MRDYPKPKVFISYARAEVPPIDDRVLLARIKDRLANFVPWEQAMPIRITMPPVTPACRPEVITNHISALLDESESESTDLGGIISTLPPEEKAHIERCDFCRWTAATFAETRHLARRAAALDAAREAYKDDTRTTQFPFNIGELLSASGIAHQMRPVCDALETVLSGDDAKADQVCRIWQQRFELAPHSEIPDRIVFAGFRCTTNFNTPLGSEGHSTEFLPFPTQKCFRGYIHVHRRPEERG